MTRPSDLDGRQLWVSEARKARARLYPPTLLYGSYVLLVLARAFRAPHRASVVVYLSSGVLAWTLLEYFIHRFILHGRFPDGDGVIRHFLHKRFDALHWEHHERPWDANHINGRIQDTLPFAAVMAGISFLFPFHAGPVFFAGMLGAGLSEEWVHHSVHFYHFRNPYFRYIKRHHLYHHSPIGKEVGYGLTSGLWDIPGRTRIPLEMRKALYRSGLRALRPPQTGMDASVTATTPDLEGRRCWMSCR